MAKRGTSLTPDEERFVDEYLIDRNGTAAYVRANPDTRRTTAAEMASRLLRKRKVRDAVLAGQKALSRRTKVNAENVIRELARVAFADIGAAFDLTRNEPALLAPRNIPFDTRRAMTAVKLKRRRLRTDDDEDYEIEDWEYKFADKLSALDKLARHLGLLKDLPPLEVLLAAVPADVAETIRAALAARLHGGGDAAGSGPCGPDPAGTPESPTGPVPVPQ